MFGTEGDEGKREKSREEGDYNILNYLSFSSPLLSPHFSPSKLRPSRVTIQGLLVEFSQFTNIFQNFLIDKYILYIIQSPLIKPSLFLHQPHPQQILT
jgi:hypothetical protein